MNINTKRGYIKEVSIKIIEAKSILRKYKKVDSWFLSGYGMNLYRGCTHDCIYCDGRSEKYNVDGEFGKDIGVKINAIDILSRELSPKRKRTPFKKCYVMVGGGVGDSYQPIEEEYQLTRKTLQLLYNYSFPIHILTKSTIVKRDIDILKKINEKNGAIVSFSFSSTNEKISSIFEPGVPPPKERLETIRFFKNENIHCGIFLMPVIPFITDTPNIMEETIKKAKEVGVDFVIFGGMTLKDGRQKDYFYKTLNEYYPHLYQDYQSIYPGSKWGEAVFPYYSSINQLFNFLMKKYKIPKRIPLHLYRNILEENDLVRIILEHIDYLLKLDGKKSPYSYAAYSISQLKKPLSSMKDELLELKGVGKVTESIIKEILDTRNCKYLKKLHNV